MCLGVPGRIVAIDDESKKTGVIDCGGVRRVAGLHLVAPPDRPLAELVDTWVLVHVGFAMSRIDEEEARRTLALLHEMGEIMQADGPAGSGP